MSLVSITSTAEQQVSTLCKENDCYAISLNLKGGGCAGFEYDWGTIQEEDLEENDFIIECDQGKLVIGSHSLMYLAGTEIDYVKSIIGSTFEIKNPNAQSACGCGVSVNFNLDKVEENAKITELT
jgi:iron-sulfur cluster assembly accessory protein